MRKFIPLSQDGIFRQYLLSLVFHCVKNVRIRSYPGPNAGKYGPE